MTVEKKVQDCDQTYSYTFEFTVNVTFETQGIRIPEHQMDYVQEAIASRLEDGVYKDKNYLEYINHKCYEIDGKSREELMEDPEFHKNHNNHYAEVVEVDVNPYDWMLEEWED